MDIREYTEQDRPRVFEYWNKVGTDIPYFFPVSAEQWQTCLLEDQLDGERTFKSLKTYLATEHDQVLGFVQYGQPYFAWDENGQKYYDPHISVIRHLYYDKDRDDVGEALLARASDDLACYAQRHAFYHIFGMSCNAYHGKLHHSQSHVEKLLQAHGFKIEHENVYYVLDMKSIIPVENVRLSFSSALGSDGTAFEIRMNTEVAGTAHGRYLDRFTDGHTHDTVYLGWIVVGEEYQGQHIGTEFLKLVVQFLLDKQYRYLHTDTASTNVRAQQFYEKLGFQNKGYTRNYVQA